MVHSDQLLPCDSSCSDLSNGTRIAFVKLERFEPGSKWRFCARHDEAMIVCKLAEIDIAIRQHGDRVSAHKHQQLGAL